MNPIRINALTGIRAIAVLMVWMYHNRKFWREDIPESGMRILNEFHVGVSLFFVLSGFLIAYTYKDKPLESGKSYLQYFLIRIARIFPVYLLLLTAKFIEEGFPFPKEAILEYTLTHAYSSYFFLRGIPQAWSLTVELSFYVVAPMLFFVMKKSILRTIGILIMIFGIAVCVGYGWMAYNGNKWLFFYDWVAILNGTFPGRSFEFFTGMLIAYFMLNPKADILARIKHRTLIGLLICGIITAVSGWLHPDIYKHGVETIPGLLMRNFLLPIGIAMLLYGLITERTWLQRLLSTRLMVLLGNASFVFYLIHISYGEQKLREIYFFPDRNFTFLWVAAIVVYLLIEKPIYEGLKGLIRRKIS